MPIFYLSYRSMLGKNHFIISLFLGILLTSLIYNIYNVDEVFILIFLFGTMTGSLIPDIDATDAAINHKRINDRGMNKFVFFTFVNPVVSRITNTMLRPFLFLMQKMTRGGINERHRGITHSIIGVFLISFIWLVIILLIFYITDIFTSIVLKIPNLLFYLLAYPVGMFFGGLCHLFEDSFTVSGIRWFQPFSIIRIRGSIKTIHKNGTKSRRLKCREKEDLIGWYFTITAIISSIFLFIYGTSFALLSILLFLIIAIFIWKVRIVK